LVSTLRLGKGKTIYTRYGDWFAWSCVAISFLGFGYALVRKGKQ